VALCTSNPQQRGYSARAARNGLVRWSRVPTGACKTCSPPPSASPRAGVLRTWILRERPETIESGLAYAVSTLHICGGLQQIGAREPHHAAIDPYQQSRFAICGLQLTRGCWRAPVAALAACGRSP
jgi:hypothetical protein